MRIATTGIVTNEYNEILLIQRRGTRSWAAPGGDIRPGELPSETVGQHILDDTGMMAAASRLAAVTYWADAKAPHLHFIFRCLQSGGQPGSTASTLQTGFFKVGNLPQPMMAVHTSRIALASYHAGPAAVWQTLKPPLLDNLKKRVRFWGEPPVQIWSVNVMMLLFNQAGQVAVNEQLQPPAEQGFQGEAPWETAARLTYAQFGDVVQPEILAGIYVWPDQPQLTLIFHASHASLEGRLPAAVWADPGEIQLPTGAPSADIVNRNQSFPTFAFWGPTPVN